MKISDRKVIFLSIIATIISEIAGIIILNNTSADQIRVAVGMLVGLPIVFWLWVALDELAILVGNTTNKLGRRIKKLIRFLLRR